MTTASEHGALAIRPIDVVKAELGAGCPPGTRVVIDWFAALTRGDLDGALALMDPKGPYFLLRQRTTISNAQFYDVMSKLVGTTFTSPIAWSVGPITEQQDRVAVVAASNAPLSAGGIYENLYHFLFRIERARIKEVYEFADTFRSAQTFSKPPGQS